MVALTVCSAGVLAAGVTATAAAFAASPKQASPSAIAQRLTVGQLAGQRVIYSYSGLTPPPALLNRIRAGKAAGVVFFASNIASAAQLHTTVGELQQAAEQSPIKEPLLMMLDQEGGEVNRLPGAPTRSEKAIGESPDAGLLAAGAGNAAGANLRAAGINVDLAPVLDVYREAGNFIDQADRSYSMSAATAGSLGTAFITHLQRAGVAATAKHFPGLGAATTDENTDEGPVTLDQPLSQIRGTDEAPYRAAIPAGVKLVMLSWAVYPALDRSLPAGFSPTVVNQELRKRLAFKGVTITDALGAGAVTRFGSYRTRGVLAARAGDDLVLAAGSGRLGEGVAALNGITRALTTGSLPRAAAQKAAARVISLRASLS